MRTGSRSRVPPCAPGGAPAGPGSVPLSEYPRTVPDLPGVPDADHAPRRIGWGWLALSVLAAVAAFLAVAVQVRRCVEDPSGGEALCTTGPALGTGGWMVGLAGACLAVYAFRRAFARR